MKYQVVFDRCAYEGEPAKYDVTIDCDSENEANGIAKQIADDPRGIAINIRVRENGVRDE